MRKFGLFIAILAVATTALTLGGNVTRAAGTCTVPSLAYPTIQSAVSDLTCTTISVAPGAYVENVTIDHTLTLKGAQAGNAVAGRTSGGPAESTVSGANPIGANAVFTIKAADVTIDGFTVKNSLTTGAATGIDVKVGGDNAMITNDIIDGITTADTFGNGTAQAIYLETGPDGVQILNNELQNVQSVRSAKGVLIGFNGGTNPSTDILIQGNSITNITSVTRGAYGVSVANVVPGTSGLQVRNNTVSNLTGGGWVHAIGLEGDTPGVLVVDNTISNLTSPSSDTVAVWFESNPSFSTGQVNYNNFNVTATVFGIAVQPTLPAGSVDGTCNWWNSPTGPTSISNPGGTGAQVSPKVSYKPWLIAPAPGGACFGGNVPTNKNDCKDGGWMARVRADGTTFKNQGDCIQYVNTGK